VSQNDESSAFMDCFRSDMRRSKRRNRRGRLVISRRPVNEPLPTHMIKVWIASEDHRKRMPLRCPYKPGSQRQHLPTLAVMQEQKRHHFVPGFYLNRFATESERVLERRRDGVECRVCPEFGCLLT
jgi:hypothetical protein